MKNNIENNHEALLALGFKEIENGWFSHKDYKSISMWDNTKVNYRDISQLVKRLIEHGYKQGVQSAKADFRAAIGLDIDEDGKVVLA